MNYGQGIYKPQPQPSFINNGVSNTQPRTRAEREYIKDHEAKIFNEAIREKMTPHKEDVKAILHSPAQNSSLFQGENQRFYKDFASEEKRNREMLQQQRQIQYEQRRLGGLEREGLIWQRNQEAQQKDELKRQYHNDQFNKGKRNANGYESSYFRLAYNPLTLEYAPTQEGQQLKRKDDLTQVRGYVRAQNLDSRANCGYNILTGENRKGVDDIVPHELKPDYHVKLQEKDNSLNIKHYALQQQLLKNQY